MSLFWSRWHSANIWSAWHFPTFHLTNSRQKSFCFLLKIRLSLAHSITGEVTHPVTNLLKYEAASYSPNTNLQSSLFSVLSWPLPFSRGTYLLSHLI